MGKCNFVGEEEVKPVGFQLLVAVGNFSEWQVSIESCQSPLRYKRKPLLCIQCQTNLDIILYAKCSQKLGNIQNLKHPSMRIREVYSHRAFGTMPKDSSPEGKKGAAICNSCYYRVSSL